MKKLMLSLDKKILDKDSRVAQRMIEYGKKDELFIVIPGRENKHFDLSPTVHVRSTGGNKLQQFFRLKKFGLLAIKKGGAEFITAQDPFFLGLIGLQIKKKTGKKLEVQLHGDFFGGDYYNKSGFKNLLQYHIGQRVVRKADMIRVVGDRVKKSLLEMGIDEKKIEMRPVVQSVSNEIAIEHQISLQGYFPESKKKFIFVGRLERVKNVHWLIEIFSEVLKVEKNYSLLILGEGSQREELEKFVKDKNLESSIKFGGYRILTPFYKTADCVLFPSLSEGYGLVPMEAHALGTAVIMNDVGVANYELQPSEKVKILPINDKEKWIEAIISKSGFPPSRE